MNDIRFLSSLGLTPKAQDALSSQGYTTVAELTASAVDLAQELDLTVIEAQDILTHVASTPSAPSQSHKSVVSSSQAVSASQLLSRPQTLPTVSTLSSSVDALLRPLQGVQQRMVVEIAGGPGVGKTAALIGLAMDARRQAEIRKAEGDTDKAGDVLIVDTEGSMSAARLEQAAHSIASESSAPAVTSSSILRGIHLMRIHTLPQFIAFFMTLETYLEANPNVSLALVDTLSHPIRSPAVPPDGKSKARIVSLIKSTLQKCSVLFDVAFVLTVQMATKFVDSEGKAGNFDPDSRAVLAPQLSEAWMPSKTQRVLLFFGGGSPVSPAIRRYATTLPSPNPNANAFSNISSSFPQSQQYSSQPPQRGGWMPGSGMTPKPRISSTLRESEQADEPKPWATFEITAEGLFADVSSDADNPDKG